MPLDPSVAGRTYPPTAPYAVGREELRTFAAAVGETGAVFHDPEAARALGYRDVVAAPTYAVRLSLAEAEKVVRDPEVGLDWARVVHGEQGFSYARPLVAGDEVVVTTTLAAVRSAGGHDLLTIRGDVATTEGEHVVTSTTLLIVRGESA
jgi:acyl dehydratase